MSVNSTISILGSTPCTATCKDFQAFCESEVSVKYRQKGNESYKKANDENLDPSLRKEKLKNALVCYKGALKTAGKDYDSAASAAKNYAKAKMRLKKARKKVTMTMT